MEASSNICGSPTDNTGNVAESIFEVLVVVKKNDESGRHPSLDLVASDLNLARLFVAVAKSARETGNVDESEFARSKAMKFYCEAFRLVLQIRNSERESFWSDLLGLSAQIRWLSITSGSRDSWSDANEDVCAESLLRLLREEG